MKCCCFMGATTIIFCFFTWTYLKSLFRPLILGHTINNGVYHQSGKTVILCALTQNLKSTVMHYSYKGSANRLWIYSFDPLYKRRIMYTRRTSVHVTQDTRWTETDNRQLIKILWPKVQLSPEDYTPAGLVKKKIVDTTDGVETKLNIS